MPHAIQIEIAPDRSARPGLTSLLRTGRGLMTVQTEIIGSPARFVTIVDLHGRVLKTWESPISLDSEDAGLPGLARVWHQDIEARIRDGLARAGQRHQRLRDDGRALAHLFVAGMQAYAERDFATAKKVLRVCELLNSDDHRIRAALARLGVASRP